MKDDDFSVDQMRDLLPRAKELRQARIVALGREIEFHRDEILKLERSIDHWQKIIPADIFPILRSEDRLAESTAEAEAERKRLQDEFERALNAAYVDRKGILPPESEWPKLARFGGVGALLGATVAWQIASHYFGLDGRLTFYMVTLAGGAMGIALGCKLFDLNFVVDRGLEFPKRWPSRYRRAELRRSADS